MPRRLVAVLALALVVVAAPGCRHDGRTLAPVQPGQTTTTSTAPASTAPTVFTLTGPVPDGSVLPTEFTCKGAGASPSLTWAAAPAAAQLALVVRDENADGYVHWIVTGISPTLGSFPQGGIPNGAADQVNSQGALGYQPPCPPTGSGRHLYVFTLYALPTAPTIDPATPAAEVATAIEQSASAQAAFTVSVAG